MDKLNELPSVPGCVVEVKITREDLNAFVRTIIENVNQSIHDEMQMINASLSALNENKAVRTNDDLSRADIRKLLGRDITNQTFLYWERRGVLPVSYRIGRSVMYSREDVKRLFDSKRRKKSAEL